ncbi:MAG: CopG family transcriptional regulator [Alphaproteobacteria bacterium]|nr:MAG: CopG family transcriptional regulator [Alphaproteobacteria bacterium]
MKQLFRLTAVAALLAVSSPTFAETIKATLYKNPQCSCCENYAAYLHLAEISRKAGVPETFQGCHTMFVNGYDVDGLVPINTVRKLLSEKPAIAGITLPGMPLGSPGMGGSKEGPFTIYAITKDGAVPSVYATE